MSARREEILGAAVALADESGLEALSMRTLAERVGVTPMALYPHVGGKATLLDSMVGRLLAELLPPEMTDEGPQVTEAGWRELLSAYARRARGLLLQHPWSAALLFSRPAATAEALHAVGQIHAALLEAGVPPLEVRRVERLVSTFVLGFAASEAGGRFGGGSPEASGPGRQVSEENHTAHSELLPCPSAPVDWNAEFEADLKDLADLIASVASRGRRA
jgi:AcrR family transcriptional regulator